MLRYIGLGSVTWGTTCNNHSPALIYGGYLPRTGVYCGAYCAPGAVYVLAICRVGCLANRLADKDKNSSAFLSYHGHLVFKLFLYLLLCFGHIQSKNEVASLEVFFKN